MNASRPTLLIFSRHLMQDRFAGNSAHVRSLIDYLRAHGVRVVLLLTSLRAFGRKPFARLSLDRAGFDDIIVSGAVRVGPWMVRYSPAVWGRAVSLIVGRVWNRLASKEGAEDRFWDIGPMDEGERRAIWRTAASLRPDAAFANYFYLAPGLDAPAFAKVPKLTMVHDIFFARAENFRSSGLALPDQEVTRDRELGDLAHADTLLSVQEAEAALLRSLLPNKQTLLMPISFPLRLPTGKPEPGTVMFVGGDSEVNAVGLRWLLEEAWPRIQARDPSTRLFIYGAIARRAAKVPAGVELVGRVDDLGPAYHRTALCVVPLRAGSGQKVKLVEAMCHGRAAVSTTVGAQGFERLIGTCFLREDDPGAFADACLRVLGDDRLRESLEAAAVAEARARFSEDACYGPVLRGLLA